MAQIGKASAFKFVIILLLVGIILAFPITLPPGAGDWDFQAYWSSAYLFAHHKDFSDANALGEIEHALPTALGKHEFLYAWFSPIGDAALLPFTYIPFTRAVYYWLILNIAILVYSVTMLWENADSRVWIPILTAFSFSMTVISLVFGQVNTLELLGLALFLSFSKSNRHYLAGASLVLTTIKPHLVIITLPILMLDLVRKKQWKSLAGFTIGLVLCFIVLFIYYPAWIQSFITIVTSGMGTVRETPSINGLLVLLGEHKFGKLLWLVVLIAGTIWWWKRGQTWDQRTFIDLSLTAGFIVAPVGWSYDQIMLLFPILSLLSWTSTGALERNTSRVIIATLVIANIFTYYLRSFVPSDVWFFWVPLVVLGLYLYARREMKAVIINL